MLEKLFNDFKYKHEGKLPFVNLRSANGKRIKKMLSDPIFTRGLILSHSLIHGISHWKKVEKFALMIARKNGADKKVVSLFSYLHDARRKNDDDDPAHGERAAILLDELIEAKVIILMAKQREQLIKALILHNKDNAKSDDITIQTCWDADRLDLWRVGIVPNPALMFTDYGKSQKMIEYAKKVNNIGLH